MTKKTMEWVKRFEERVASAPGQAEIDAPHWIVVNHSRHKELPEQRRVALYFRHATEDSAIREASRLAASMPGKRFTVYASGLSVKNEETPASE